MAALAAAVSDEVVRIQRAWRDARAAAQERKDVPWVANKRFEILKFKFKIPRARTSELQGSFSAVSKPNFASNF